MRSHAKASSFGSTSGTDNRPGLLALVAFSILALAAFLGSGASAATAAEGECANEAIRAAQKSAELPEGTVHFPDCMALEMVSPPKKFNQQATSGHVSADGERILFRAKGALADTTGLLDAIGGDPYIASRGTAGWLTEATNPPAGYVTGKRTAESFSPDLSQWFHPNLGTQLQGGQGIGQSYRGGLDGSFSPLSSLLVPLSGPVTFTSSEGTQVQGASADHSRLFIQPTGFVLEASYLPGDPVPAGSGAEPNPYVAKLDTNGNPSLELLARDGEGKVWGGNCGARLGGVAQLAVSDASSGNGLRNQGAISLDGTRTYISARVTQPPSGNCVSTNKLRILKRIETSAGPWISPLFSSECTRVSPVCDTTDGHDLYQGASVDGTKVYFTTNRQLVDSDLDTGTQCSTSAAAAGCDLYLYDSTQPAGQRLTQVSAGEDVPTKHEVGKEAKVFNGIAAISGDGSRVYFAATGVLTEDENPEGKSADEVPATDPKLYMWDAETETTAFIGGLVAGGANDGATIVGLYGTRRGSFKNGAFPLPALGQDASGNEVGGDGHILLFHSKAALTADDTDGTRRDIFRYDAETDQLERITKAAPGGVDNGAFDASASIAGSTSISTDILESSRWASEDGETVVFQTVGGLVPDDTNGVNDFYLWRGGQLVRLPGTGDISGKLFGDADLSHDGDTVAFQSLDQLLPQDGDTIHDVYALRVNGGFPIPVTEVCVPDANDGCQGPVTAPTGSGAAASVGFTGPGNLKPAPPSKRCPKGKRKARRKGTVRCVNKKASKRNKRTGHKQGGQK